MVLDEPKDEDEKFEFEGLTYIVDKELGTKAGAIKVDYIDSGWQQGFALSAANPLSESAGFSCGNSCSC